MSLEQALAENTKAYLENTAAVNALTAILKGQQPIGVNPDNKKEDKLKTVNETKPEVKTVENTPPPVTHEIPSLEETTKTLMALAKLDRESAVAILTSYRVKKASDVPEDKRAEFLQLVNERLQKLQE